MASNWAYGVRAAIPSEEDAIYRMLLEMHEENGLFAVSEPKVRETIRAASSQQGGLIGVIGDNEPEASCCLEIGQWWYTDEWSLNEKWLFVRKEFRRTASRQESHAKRLIKWAKWCESQLGIPLFIGLTSTERTKAKERLFARELTHVGGIFMHRNGHAPEAFAQKEASDV